MPDSSDPLERVERLPILTEPVGVAMASYARSAGAMQS